MYSGIMQACRIHIGYYSEEDYKQLQESTQGVYTGGTHDVHDPDSGVVGVL